jgi:hypothetical protein
LFWDVQNSCLLAQTLTLSGTVKSCESWKHYPQVLVCT